MPKVSVIMPAFNSERYIASALNSVMAQSCQDFEIIVIDDGSADRTREIAQSFPRVRLLSTGGNYGPGAARNAGITHSNGEFVSFLDADDLWFSVKLARDLEYFESHPDVGMVYSDTRVFRTGQQGAMTVEGVLRSPFEGAPLDRLIVRNFIPCLSVTVRRECFALAGLFDEAREIMSCHDYHLWLRMACCCRVRHIDAILSAYRLHDGNMVGIPSLDRTVEAIGKIEVMERQHQLMLHKLFESLPSLPAQCGMTPEECLAAVTRHYQAWRCGLEQDRTPRAGS
jgi:glycosyltransferase involved in cell wall biosynthesis